MPPRIVFVIMSAVAPPATVDQLARSLWPHTVLVHHDFSQVPGFRLSAPNVVFVPDPKRTGWATFGFVEGIFHALRHAVDQFAFDYLQLLSPSCLPIQPMAQFEAHVAQGVDAHFGAIDVLGDRDCLMNVGYRAFTREGTLRHRVLRRLTHEYFEGTTDRREEAGVWLRRRDPHAGLRASAGQALLRHMARASATGHPFGPQLPPYFGSVWFGARKDVVRDVVEGFHEPQVHRWAAGMRIGEEFLVPSLLMRATRTRGRLNHYISRFDEAHPGRVALGDLPELQASRAFFARKFPEDPADPVRLAVLRDLVGLDVGPHASPDAISPIAVARGERSGLASSIPVGMPGSALGGSAMPAV